MRIDRRLETCTHEQSGATIVRNQSTSCCLSSFGGSRQSPLARVLAGFILCMLMASGGKCSSPEQVPLGGAQDLYPDVRKDRTLFKRYLENPYPIRSVRYLCVAEDVSSRSLSNTMVIAEGSLQDNTFFHRYMAHDSSQPEFLRNTVSGQSCDGTFWALDGRAMSGTGGRVELALAKTTAYTRATSRSTSGLLELRCVCWFGLRMLVPRTLRWEGNGFTASWYDVQWPQNTNTVSVSGEVLSFSNNLPVTIRLKCSTWPGSYRHVDVHYEYDGRSGSHWYPSRIWSEAALETGSVRGQFFDQIQIGFGRSQLPAGGYKPSDFLPYSNNAPPMTLVASNKGVFLEKDGGLVEVEGPASVPRPFASPHLVRRVIFVVLIISLLLPIVITLARGRWFGRGKD